MVKCLFFRFGRYVYIWLIKMAFDNDWDKKDANNE